MASVSVNGVLSASYQYNHLGHQVVRSYSSSRLKLDSFDQFNRRI